MPPDLSKISQLRGNNWLTADLLGFYPDPVRPFGVSNHKINQVMMPNVLFPVEQRMSPQDFKKVIADIVSFLDYAADPTQALRYKIGFWVVSFFGILLGLLGLYGLRKK
jgi:ubiquinol-cytochrome c reductase cytochrome c1 subunit